MAKFGFRTVKMMEIPGDVLVASLSVGLAAAAVIANPGFRQEPPESGFWLVTMMFGMLLWPWISVFWTSAVKKRRFIALAAILGIATLVAAELAVSGHFMSLDLTPGHFAVGSTPHYVVLIDRIALLFGLV